jgi:hypothetical protein
LAKHRYKVVGQNEDGKDRKVYKVEYHDTHPNELIEYLKPHLKAFVLHKFIYKWQDVQFRGCLTNVIENIIIFYVDFLRTTPSWYKMRYKTCIGIISK